MESKTFTTKKRASIKTKSKVEINDNSARTPVYAQLLYVSVSVGLLTNVYIHKYLICPWPVVITNFLWLSQRKYLFFLFG